jgi:glycogen synthase
VLEHELDMDDIAPVDVSMIAGSIQRAIKLYGDKATLRTIQVAAMKAAKDYSWTKATKQYVEHFLVRPPPIPPPPPLS